MATDDFKISWKAAIIPCKSLAGIPIHASAELLKSVLGRYVVDEENLLYQFEDSPILRLKSYDPASDGGYAFSLADDTVIDKLLKGKPALSISLRGNRVTFIKIYNFSFSGDAAENYIYKGTLPGNIGLGSLVSELLPYTRLELDETEEFFYTDAQYGEVEVTGLGVPLEDIPDQHITAICLIPT
ncbi:hypothetical protein KID98_23190 [Pseudomonas syringae]|uniref:hypothetical protein n=1 Tax=Pseudomonas syringae TaxID=317 RepID=UPI001BCEB234|nr:hypothetical protein [Pseudomonas syringae]MBS7473697.1 hypothetical protein [Pseudomonas syringae]